MDGKGLEIAHNGVRVDDVVEVRRATGECATELPTGQGRVSHEGR